MTANKRRWHRLLQFTIALLLLSCIVLYMQAIQFEYTNFEHYERAQVNIKDVLPPAEESFPADYVLALSEFIAATPNRSQTNAWEFYQYNVLHSDRVGAFRALPDTRDSSCTTRRPYNFNVQRSRVSVIIAFHNEARSTLLRTIMSLYHRTPTIYLHELILIDDCSEDAYLLPAMLRIKLQPFMYNISSMPTTKSTHTPPKPLPISHHVKIKTARNTQRSGVIASRNRGARLATGDYLLFLDSHCEVNVGWLEPLLERVARGDKTTATTGDGDGNGVGVGASTVIAVSPVLDSIDTDSLKYVATSKNLMGGFDWNLHFHWIPRSQSMQSLEKQPQAKQQQEGRVQQSVEITNEKSKYLWQYGGESKSFRATENEKHINIGSKPFKSPTFAGGIFMISREWFFKLNGFNPLLQTWGGESIEFSIKCWLCGGQIEIVPCSRVGHIFRERHPFNFPNGSDSQTTYLRNSKIIAESWLDAYKYFFYASKPSARRIHINISDTQFTHQLRSALKCRPFSWYLQHVFPQLKLPNDDFIAFGTLSSGELCLQIINSVINVNDASQLHMSSCYQSNVTHWYLHRQYSQLQTSSGACLNVVEVPQIATVLRRPMHSPHFRVVLEQCFGRRADIDGNGHNPSENLKQNQRWLRRGGWLVHQQTQLCLDNPLSDLVVVSHCRNAAPSQLFRFAMEVQRL